MQPPQKINELFNIREKLQLPSANLAMITGRRFQALHIKKHNRKPKLKGIVFDESKAYRGIGVKFEHLKYSVVAVKNPKGGAAFFIMNSMMFGSNAAVPNYNRRAMLLTKILRVAFKIPLYNNFDDKHCLELRTTSASALECIVQCHRVWGILYGEDKIQHGSEITILGVGFHFRHLVIDLTAARRAALLQEIQEALSTDKLTQGAAGKLKGTIYFAIEHQFGKCGGICSGPCQKGSTKVAQVQGLVNPSGNHWKTSVLCYVNSCRAPLKTSWATPMSTLSSWTVGGLRHSRTVHK